MRSIHNVGFMEHSEEHDDVQMFVSQSSSACGIPFQPSAHLSAILFLRSIGTGEL